MLSDETYDPAKGHPDAKVEAPADTFIQPKITGYRQLIPAETHLINEAKAIGAAAEDLVKRLREYHAAQYQASVTSPGENARLMDAEPARWLAMGRTDIQTGVMKIVRSIAQPAS